MLSKRSPVPTPVVKTVGRGALLSQDNGRLLPLGTTRTPPPTSGMKLRNIDVIIGFEDGSQIGVLLAHASHPLRAVVAVISEAERTLSAERLSSIKWIKFR